MKQTSSHIGADLADEELSHEAAKTRSRRNAITIGILLALQIALWVVVFGVDGLFREGPNGKAMATDFAVFSAAANALRHGQNPYDYRVLYRSERALLIPQHLPVTTNAFNVRAGNPPLFYWALEPLTRLPFQPVAWVWIITMYAASAAGFLLALDYLGWSSRIVPTVVFLLMPEVVTGAVYANVHGPVFAALSLCLVMMRRHPAWAGAVASCGWLKPQLALPLVLVIFLFHCTNRKRMLVGFAAATALFLVLTLLTTGPHSLVNWVSGLNNWSKGIAKEPNIASLSGLYAAWAPRSLQVAFAVVLLFLAALVTAVTWQRLRRQGPASVRGVGWLWALWFLVSPFTHYPDLIILTIPVLALMGHNGGRIALPLGASALWLAFFSLILFPSPLVPLAVMALLALLAIGARTGDGFDARVRAEADAGASA